MSHSVSLKGLCKRFGSQTVLNSVDLEIQPGELLTLLGPSGCGKTTLLRAIAGFYHPDAGRILLNGQDITEKPTHLRDMGMVFQNYAVFPHLNVFENVAYGLKTRGCQDKEVQSRVHEALRKVKLEHLPQRYPSELSGGQKQRVGLARALVIEPTLLLMDEPLSNLDAKLRIEMRQEIRLLQRELGITTLYVTHDQEEALAVSDRIAVMNSGNIVQLGSPENVYTDPEHPFVMDFVGGCNWVKGLVVGDARAVQLQTNEGCLVPIDHLIPTHLAEFCLGKQVQLGIRTDAIHFSDTSSQGGWNRVGIKLVTYLGSHLQYQVQTLDGLDLVFNSPRSLPAKVEGATVSLEINPTGTYLFDAESGKRLI
jgi:ABC-type Fe3+/spermidine/putrescine transport system ATPase subunit